MALQDLSPAEMVEISTVWTTQPGKLSDGNPIPTVRPKLEALAILAGMLPPLEDVQQRLLGVLGKTAPDILTEIAKIEDEQVKIDETHDSRNRFIYPFLGIAVELASPSLKRVLLDLQERLYPVGLVVNRYKYEREAGEARLLEGKLTVEDQKLLESISISIEGQSYTMLFLVQDMIEKAKHLGELEKIKKDHLAHLIDPGPSEYELSNLWINRVTTLVRLLDTAVDLKQLSPESKEEILAPMNRLAQSALQRRLARDKKKTTEPSAAPKNDETK
jgi:hypothetical protein